MQGRLSPLHLFSLLDLDKEGIRWEIQREGRVARRSRVSAFKLLASQDNSRHSATRGDALARILQMPYGKYPDRVKPFRRWAGDQTDKARITDSVTGGRKRSYPMLRRKRRKRKSDGTT